VRAAPVEAAERRCRRRAGAEKVLGEEKKETRVVLVLPLLCFTPSDKRGWRGVVLNIAVCAS